MSANDRPNPIPHAAPRLWPRFAGLLLGLALVVSMAAIDAISPNTILVTTVAIGPIAVALMGDVRETVAVALVAALVAFLSPLWDHNFGGWAYWLRALVISAASAAAVLAARGRVHAHENAELYEERAFVARTLESSLLPGRLPSLPGWHTATLYHPARSRVGGDFYDAFQLPDGWMLVLGDVMGHGTRAAALTALMRHTLRVAAALTGSPIAALAELNRVLCSQPPQITPCAAVCAVVRDRQGVAGLEVITAGAPLPILVRQGAAQAIGEPGPLLGMTANAAWAAHPVSVRDADLLVLYSDGVLDTKGEHDRFGEARLMETLSGCGDAGESVNRIDRALLAFQAEEHADDVTVLAIKRHRFTNAIARRAITQRRVERRTPAPGR
jgi:serine phosphatase RsbU (regulator of sigma subunit)